MLPGVRHLALFTVLTLVRLSFYICAQLANKLVEFIIFLMIRLQAVTRASGWTLNEDRILLPLTDEGATFKLFTDGGCFEWKSSRPEVSIKIRTTCI